MSSDIRSFVATMPCVVRENGDMSKVYSNTKTSITNSIKNGSCISTDVMQNVLRLIKNDSNSKDSSVRNAAKDMLQFLFTTNVRNTEMDIFLLESIFDGKMNKEFSSLILTNLARRIDETLTEGMNSFNIQEICLNLNGTNTAKVIKALDELISEHLSSETRKTILLDKVIPAMFDPNINDSARDCLTQLGFKLLAKVPTDTISSKEMELQIKNISDRYIQFVAHLREKEYANWHQLWIFLVRFCGKNIHNSMELANKLLRVVEYAFRNTSYQQRLVGYDCWKEFIDNASLDLDHMCSHKQIKLLVTPLKAKFSKMEVVICKRFDVFVYLLEKLQHRAVLCLNEFLEFCFGPLSDNVEVNKTGQGKAVSQLWGKSTRVLMEILGHSHGSDETCLEDKIIKLDMPVLNSENIVNFVEVTIKALSECFMLLKDWCNNEVQQQKIIKCLWGSFLKLILDSEDAQRKKCNQVLVQYLDSMAKKMEDEHIKNIFINIIDKTLTYDKVLISELFTPTIIECTLKILFTQNISEDIAEKITLFMCLCIVSKKKDQYIMSIINCIHDVESTKNTESICKIWLMLEDIDDFKNSNATVEKTISFLMWPVQHYHALSEEIRQAVLLNWAKIYTYLCNDSEENKCSFLSSLEKVFKSNPLRSSTIISFVAIISQFERNHHQEFVTRFFKLCAAVLTLPTLQKHDLLKLCSVILEFMDLSLPFYDFEDNEGIIKCMSVCFEHILKIHKHYDLLSSLLSCIKGMPNKLKVRFLSPLADLLKELITHEDPKVSEEAYILLSFANMELKDKKSKNSTSPGFQVPNSRASKIASMTKDDKTNKIVQQNTLQLFNAGLEPTTPIKIKGSPLSNPSPKRARKIMNALPKKEVRPPLIEENSSDFVPINTVVRFQPNKLSEHQKEVMKKRREDIPALYQDLSQSQSQDLFKSGSSNSASVSNKIQDSFHSKSNGVREEESQNLEKENIATELNEAPSENPNSEDIKNSEQRNEPTEGVIPNVVDKAENDDKERLPKENEDMDTLPNENVKNLIEDHKLNQGYNSDTSVASNDSTKSKKKKLSKIEIELNRIKMDIVGGDQFVQNIATRRTRSALESEKLTLRPRNTDNNQESKPKKIPRSSQKPRDTPTKNGGKQKKAKGFKRLSFPEIISPTPHTPSETKDEHNVEMKETDNFVQDTADTVQVVENQSLADVETPVESSSIKPSSPKKTPKISPPKSPVKVLPLRSPAKIVPPRSPVKISAPKSSIDISAKVNEPMEMDVNPDDSKASVYDFRESQDELLEHSYASFERKKDNKRKNSNESPKYSEDIIESSQDSYVNVNSVLSPKKRRSSRDKSLDKASEHEKTITPQDIQLFKAGKSISDLQVQEKNSGQSAAETPTDNDTETCDSSTVTPVPIVITIDRPKKPELTDSQKALCKMDTESLTADELSPDRIREIIGEDALFSNSKNIEIVVEKETSPKGCLEKEKKSPTSQTSAVSPLRRSRSTGGLVLNTKELLTPSRTLRSNSLPTSPVTGDTPNKTSELLSDTMNISPITSQQSSPLPEEKNRLKQDALLRCSPSNQIEEVISPDNGDINEEVNGTEINEDNNDKYKKLTMSGKEPLLRSGKLLNMINVDSPVTHRTIPKRRKFRIAMSPAAGRIKKLMSNFQNIKSSADETDQDKVETQDDMLTFSREVPSPYAIPRGGILKRKYPEDLDDGVSPCAKRKRVNFSDPTTTSKKVFIKHKDEYPVYVPDRVALTASILFRDIEMEEEEEDAACNALSSENKTSADVPLYQNQLVEDKTTVNNANHNGADSEDKIVQNDEVPEETVDEAKNSESTNTNSDSAAINTAESLDVVNPILLDNSKPVYENLVDCNDDLLPILKKVTSPMFVTSLLKDLNQINVRTIGDLARLTEAKINRLPFKEPAVSNVYKSLDLYYKKKFGNGKTSKSPVPQKNKKEKEKINNISKSSSVSDGDAACNNCPDKKSPSKKSPVKKSPSKIGQRKETSTVSSAATPQSPTKTNQIKQTSVVSLPPINLEETHMKLRDILEWTGFSTKQEAACVVNKLLGHHKDSMLPLVRDFYKCNMNEVILEKDMKAIMEHILSKLGISETVKLISQINNTDDNESVYFNSIVKESIDKRPVVSLLERRSADEIITGVQTLMEAQPQLKIDLIKNCFIPNIRTPEDVLPCLAQLTTVQLGDVLVKRITSADIDIFLDKIMKTYGSETVYNSVNKNEVIEMCALEDVIPVVAKNSDAKEIVRFFDKAVSSIDNEEVQSEVLTSMFRCISNRLSVDALTSLHIEFIKNMADKIRH